MFFCCVATQQSCESFSKSTYQKLRTSKKKENIKSFHYKRVKISTDI